MKVVILAFNSRNIHISLRIRRYPDLVIHRILKSILLNTEVVYTQNLLEDQCAELSELEKRAEQEISRQVTQQLICYHLENEIGKTFNSKIVSVTSFGSFVKLKIFYFRTLHVSDLPSDYYLYNEHQNYLKGRKRGMGV